MSAFKSPTDGFDGPSIGSHCAAHTLTGKFEVAAFGGPEINSPAPAAGVSINLLPKR